IDDKLTVLAAAGSPHAGGRPTIVGVQFPYSPPNGAAFAVWDDDESLESWLQVLSDSERGQQRERLAAVRQRGYSLGLISEAQREFASAVDLLASDPSAVKHEDLHALTLRQNFDPLEMNDTAWEDV